MDDIERVKELLAVYKKWQQADPHSRERVEYWNTYVDLRDCKPKGSTAKKSGPKPRPRIVNLDFKFRTKDVGKGSE